MTKLSAAMLVAGAVLDVIISHADAQTVLFSDNFNRVNNNSLSADTTGMSGALGPLTYLETWQNGSPGNDATLQVNNNTLTKFNTGGAGAGGLNHNFNDASILSAGGFSVSMDIVSLSANALDMPDRWGGFGVGLSLAQINGFTDENTADTGPRGAIALDTAPSTIGVYGTDAYMHTGVAPFFVDLSLENKVQVFAAGMLVGQYAVTPTGSHTLTANFSLADFNAGSAVNYTVSFEGNQVAAGSFNWSGTDQNYLGFSLRDATVVADNLSVSTIAPAPEPTSAALVLIGGAALFIRRRKA